MRLLIASVYIVSGAEKLLQPYQNFAYVVQGYDLLHHAALENLTARIFPWLEYFIGGLLLIGLWTRLALTGIAVFSGIFIFAVGQAIARHLPLDECGCFGDLVGMPLEVTLAIDCIILVATVSLLYLFNKGTIWWALDGYWSNKGRIGSVDSAAQISPREAYQWFTAREEQFKRFGYDIKSERRWIIEESRPLEGKILEIGTGKGNLTLALAQEGCQLTTVDVSVEEQIFARQIIQYHGLEKKVNFLAQHACRMQFQAGIFNRVFAVNLVHHLSELDRALEEMLRVTAHGGKMIISDFTEKGFEIIDQIHRFEGRRHKKGPYSLRNVQDYLNRNHICFDRKNSDIQELILITVLKP
jgi:ubiquinone/menaquinone biosynthesis C-methylase UbiE/uncharacterized membrane protein YphA (DoxX/SURF4 family)